MKPFRTFVLLCLAGCLGWSLAAAPVPLKTMEFGRGPAVVFLHGLGSSRTVWLPTAKKLLGAHRVVMMDLPGHGDSPLPDPFSLDVAAEAIAQALASQKAESTVVVGQGVGGVLALMVASGHPERMRGLVVIDATLKPENPVPDQMQRFYLQAMDEHYDEMLKGMYTRMGRDSAQGVILHAQAAQVPSATMKAYLRELLHLDATKALKSLKTPLLVIGSEKRWPAEKGWAEIAKQTGYEGVDSSATRRIPNCGPLIASEQPDSLAAVLAAFTRTVLAKK